MGGKKRNRSLTRAGEKEALGQPSRPARSESVRGRGLSSFSKLLIVYIMRYDFPHCISASDISATQESLLKSSHRQAHSAPTALSEENRLAKCAAEASLETNITGHSLRPGGLPSAPWHPDSLQTSRRVRELSREISSDSPRYILQRSNLSHHP